MKIRIIVALLIVAVLATITACINPALPTTSPLPPTTSPSPPTISPSPLTTSPSPPPGLRLPDVYNILIVKYDSSGGQVWQRIEHFESKYAFDPVNLDRSGHSYITGPNYDAKFDSNGEQVYLNTFAGVDLIARKSILDDLGNIYLIGEPNSGDQIITSKFDDKGKMVWTKSYHYPESLFTFPSEIALDKSGNVFVAGVTTPTKDTTTSTPIILKFDNSGKLLWVVKDEGLLRGGQIIGVVVDTNGNIYLAGSTVISNSFQIDYVTVKFDSEGKKLWESRYNGPANRYDVPHAMKVDSDGSVIVTGESDGPVREVATVKYDKDGKELWVSRYNGANGSGGTPSEMAIDGQGNIYITGRGFNPAGGDDFITIKYDSNGQQKWDARYAAIKGKINEASALYVDEHGNVYVAGRCALDSAYVTFDTIKYDPDGVQLWVAKFSKTYFSDSPDILMTDALGNVYLIGRYSYYSSIPPSPIVTTAPPPAFTTLVLGGCCSAWLILRKRVYRRT